jgi:alkylhydroperoxidase family enzyme
MEVNSAVGRGDGIQEEDLAALAAYSGHPAFTARERAALAYAESMTGGNQVPDDLFARVRSHFSEDETVELTAIIAWEICAAKFNRALEIEGQGICLLPFNAPPMRADPSG